MPNIPAFIPPKTLAQIKLKSASLGFSMACEDEVGVLLRVLAASKKSSRLLELGTGTGVGTSWLLDGMDRESTLVTVDVNPSFQGVVREAFTGDDRLQIVTGDAAVFLATQPPRSFDLVFADAMPGKFIHLDAALSLVRAGGFYIVDDLFPQPNWPSDHPPKVEALIARLTSLPEFRSVLLPWSSGVMLLTRA